MLQILITDEVIERRLIDLARTEQITESTVVERYLAEILGAPAAPVAGRRAIDRNADVVVALLKANPDGLTVRAVERLTGWCRLTCANVLLHALARGLVVRKQIATGRAPAWCYFLPATDAQASNETPILPNLS